MVNHSVVKTFFSRLKIHEKKAQKKKKKKNKERGLSRAIAPRRQLGRLSILIIVND